MLEALEKIMKEYRKNMQKAKVKAVGFSGSQSKEQTKEKIIRLGEKESKAAQKAISTATAGLQETVKGQFSKKVTQVLDQQKETLDNF